MEQDGMRKQLTPRWIALFVITALTLYLAWLVISPFANVLLWAIVISVIATPLNNALKRRWRSPNLCAAVTLLIAVLVLVIPMAFVVMTLVAKADEAAKTLQAAFAAATDPTAWHMQWLSRFVDVKGLSVAPSAATQPTTQAADLHSFGELLKRYSDPIAAQVNSLLRQGLLAVVQALLVLFTSYYMLRDSARLVQGVREMLPLSRRQADLMIDSIKTIIGASLKGTILIAAIQGVLGGIGFWMLGLPSALLWAAVMFLTALIPVVGSSIIWAPAAIYLLSQGQPVRALVMVIWGAGVIATVDNLLRPVLVGSKTRMHELTVFFSVLGGLQLFGPVGIIMGPIVIAVAAGLLRIFQETDGHAETEPATDETTTTTTDQAH
jgi:predicted PurR-regulated permease PerM